MKKVSLQLRSEVFEVEEEEANHAGGAERVIVWAANQNGDQRAAAQTSADGSALERSCARSEKGRMSRIQY